MHEENSEEGIYMYVCIYICSRHSYIKGKVLNRVLSALCIFPRVGIMHKEKKVEENKF